MLSFLLNFVCIIWGTGQNPSYYQDEVVTFTGVISNFVQGSSGDTTAANVSASDDPFSLIQVEFSPLLLGTNGINSMNKGDTIQVWGKGLGSFTGKNAFGGTISEGVVSETYLSDQTNGYVDDLNRNPN